MATVYLGLGGNLGDRVANLRAALRALTAGGVAITAVSPFYETDPVGYADQPPFVNAVAVGDTTLSPDALLTLAKAIERDLGRQPSFRNAPRPVDIDILLYDDLTRDDPALTLPHPRLAERAFVLAPLADLAPDLRLPDGHTVAAQLERVGRRGVRPFDDVGSRPAVDRDRAAPTDPI
ncbi:MAG: 2-amino-4-hydroxy-6-hydroxymethyldihydropteridine diphosphokinase [Dehalococcoidia bacterium]|nr:2-amino-4-hydroxy-6-hydroxymethyldihydropteridine diphosphokinase [Dehalococcoidia bacterium]